LDAHPLLRSLFTDLEERRVRWALLRVPSDLTRPSGDVDLLVAREDLHALVATAQRHGFVSLPGWETLPDLILISYDGDSDHWLVLDVSTTVSFRTPGGAELDGAAHQVLSRRHVEQAIALPADGDAFWLLLGHCLFDKGSVPQRYRERLQQLAVRSDDSALGEALLRAAGRDSDPPAFRDAALTGDWPRLEEMGARLAANLKRRRSRREKVGTAARTTLRVSRKPLLLRRRRGLSIALLGPNGVGKSTAAAGVERDFPLGATVVHMGLWKAASASPRARPAEVLTRPFRLWARSAVAHYHQARGRLVIYDRYVYEARLPAKPPLVALKKLYYRLLERMLPRPDAAIVLDVPGDVAYRRKQENPPEELESERRVYAELAAREPQVEIVDASRGADAVRTDVTAIVWSRLQARWRKGDSGCGPTTG
jgi:Thymidylate kinase